MKSNLKKYWYDNNLLNNNNNNKNTGKIINNRLNNNNNNNSLFLLQLEGSPPISVSEIQEVIRRFYSTLLCPFGAFTTNFDPTVFNRILSF